jgi:hypothetical protein
MSQEAYKIRKAIVIPLAIAVFSLAGLLLLSLSFSSFPGERFVLTFVFVDVLYLVTAGRFFRRSSSFCNYCGHSLASFIFSL